MLSAIMEIISFVNLYSVIYGDRKSFLNHPSRMHFTWLHRANEYLLTSIILWSFLGHAWRWWVSCITGLHKELVVKRCQMMNSSDELYSWWLSFFSVLFVTPLLLRSWNIENFHLTLTECTLLHNFLATFLLGYCFSVSVWVELRAAF